MINRYKFPTIKNIDDVLPYIEGHDEFPVSNVSGRDDMTVICYVVADENTFDMKDSDDIGAAIRRECRGLIFDSEGNLVSRPFHKFFNVNEREETQSNCIDLSKDHVVMEKMDGSMIRPIIADGYLRLATKRGITEVAMAAEAWLSSHKDSADKTHYMIKAVNRGETPIFEWISPFNQIVVAYEKADLVYLGSRRNETGEYFFDETAPFTLVDRYGNLDGSVNDYINRQKGVEKREGDIIRFADGHMVKIKNEWYVNIHKCLDRITFDRNIITLILREDLDDILPFLPQVRVDYVLELQTRFTESLNSAIEHYDEYWKEVKISGIDRKQYALGWAPEIKKKDSFAPIFIFGKFNGNDTRTMILEHITKQLTTNKRWDACAQWLRM